MKCPLCKNDQFIFALTRNGFDLARCTQCNLLQVSPMPNDNFLSQHYQNPAYYCGEADQGYANYDDMEKALLPHFQRRLSLLDKQLPRKGRLLDFGCAAGYFLRTAKEAGWQVTGVELSQEMAKNTAQRLGVEVANSMAELSQEKFNAITLWEVVEHLPRPLEQLKQFYGALQPGGAVMLSTPNNGHWQAVRQPDRWIQYRPPSHLIYFTRQTLTQTLVAAGFENVSVRGVMPLPPLPAWLQRLTAPLEQRLGSGQAKHWRLELYTWRATRLLGMVWQKFAYPTDDIYATLEAIAFRPH